MLSQSSTKINLSIIQMCGNLVLSRKHRPLKLSAGYPANLNRFEIFPPTPSRITRSKTQPTAIVPVLTSAHTKMETSMVQNDRTFIGTWNATTLTPYTHAQVSGISFSHMQMHLSIDLSLPHHWYRTEKERYTHTTSAFTPHTLRSTVPVDYRRRIHPLNIRIL
jgi:hypothetical protein